MSTDATVTGVQDQMNTMGMQGVQGMQGMQGMQFMSPMTMNNQMTSQPLLQEGMLPAQFASLPLQPQQTSNQVPLQGSATTQLQQFQLQPNMIPAPLNTSVPLSMPMGTSSLTSLPAAFPVSGLQTSTPILTSSLGQPGFSANGAAGAACTAPGTMIGATPANAAPAVAMLPMGTGGAGPANRPDSEEKGQPSLFVGGFPHDWTQTEVADLLKISIGDAAFHMKEGYCFVNFKEEGMAERKARELDGIRLESTGKILGVRVQTKDNHMKAREHAAKRKAAAAAAAAAQVTQAPGLAQPSTAPLQTTTFPAATSQTQVPMQQTLPAQTMTGADDPNNALFQPFGVGQLDPQITYSTVPVIQQNAQVMLQPQRLTQTVQSQPALYNTGSQGLMQTNLMSNVPNQQQIMQPFVMPSVDGTNAQNMQLNQPLEEALMLQGVQGLEDDKKKFRKVKRNHPSVFVGGLNNKVTEKELQAMFGTVGEILNITIKTGFAFIDFSDEDAGLRAVKCNGQLLDGKPVAVRVQTAENRKTAQEAKRSGNNVPAVFKKLEETSIGMRSPMEGIVPNAP